MQPTIIVLVPVLIVLALVYLTTIRPWQLRWGATREEAERKMHGDDIVSQPSFDATRAVTINASAEHIYPWILQMGIHRAGWYSYDVLDNALKPSADRILDEYQNINAGDLIPISPDGKQGFWVKDFDRNRRMLWWDKKGDSSWAWEIYPEGEGASRLITRVRVKYRWFSPAILFSLLIEFTDIIMMRKCMLGIKSRAEKLAFTA
jgi:hypothetical protein